LALVLFLVAAEAVGVAGLVAVVETPQVHPSAENHPPKGSKGIQDGYFMGWVYEGIDHIIQRLI